MVNMFFVVLSIIVFSVNSSVVDDVSNLELNRLVALVNSEIQRAKKYKMRTDNEDLIGCGRNSKNVHCFGQFDFIIVGAGSAGSVLANRLTEVKDWNVLVLEAGDINDELTDIPYMYTVAGLSDRDWGYLTTPQKNACFGRKNNQCPQPRGKILGGSGSINGLVWARGVKKDYERWAKEGNTGWSWQEVLQYYKKIENFKAPNVNTAYRGTNGPLNIKYVVPPDPIERVYIQASEEIGLPYVQDFNAEKIVGSSDMQFNINNGRRVSGATNYIKPVWDCRANLNVTLKAFVTKILIKKSTKVAYGVEFIKNCKRYRATARNEVIVSGGAVNSPQLLMLSGIGPKRDLRNKGIRVIQDLPVGQFLKDHIMLSFFMKTNYTASVYSNRKLISDYLNGEGLYTACTGFKGISYFNATDPNSDYPEIENSFSSPQNIETGLPEFQNFKDDTAKFFASKSPFKYWNHHMYLVHPKSSGTITLKSSNPKDFPLIDSNVFGEKEDIDIMYKGLEELLKMVDTPIGKKYGLAIDIELPACSFQKYLSKAFWYCVLRQIAKPAYHISSSCKMGPRNDSLAVVSPELKVYGIKNLRVIDVSIIPGTVTGHINAQAFLIGEKGSDMIKKDYGKL